MMWQQEIKPIATQHSSAWCCGVVSRPLPRPALSNRRLKMKWTKPSFTDMRFGFEITMYIATR